MAPSFDLAGRRALVTGGANGIGRAAALGLAAAGADVFITARSDGEAARSACAEIGALGRKAGHLLLDAGEEGAAEAVWEAAAAAIGVPDILVNNAAMAKRTVFLEVEAAEYDGVFAVNLRFPFFLLQTFAARLIERGLAGSAINVSSISAFKAISRMSVYQCSKAGLSMLTKSAAVELAPHGIRVNTISPGLTATKANRNQWQDDPSLWRERGADIPIGRTGLPSDFVGAAVFLASDASAFMTGADLVVDGGDAAV